MATKISERDRKRLEYLEARVRRAVMDVTTPFGFWDRAQADELERLRAKVRGDTDGSE